MANISLNNGNIKNNFAKTKVSSKQNKVKAQETAKTSKVKTSAKTTAKQALSGLTNGTMSVSKAVSVIKEEAPVKATKTGNLTTVTTKVDNKSVKIVTNDPTVLSDDKTAAAKTSNTASKSNSPANNSARKAKKGNNGGPNTSGWNWQRGNNPHNPLRDNKFGLSNNVNNSILTFSSTNVNLFSTINTAFGFFGGSLPNTFNGSSWDFTVGKYTWTDNTSGKSNGGYQIGVVWHLDQKDKKSSSSEKLDDLFGLQPTNPDYNANSTSSTQNTDGSKTTNSDSSKTTNSDGSKTTNSDGSKTTNSDGSKTTNSDGPTTTTDKKGNVTVTGQKDNYGNTQNSYYNAKTGTTTTTTYTTSDGTQGGNPATITTVTDKNGNTTTTLTTTDNNGNPVTITADRNGNITYNYGSNNDSARDAIYSWFDQISGISSDGFLSGRGYGGFSDDLSGRSGGGGGGGGGISANRVYDDSEERINEANIAHLWSTMFK